MGIVFYPRYYEWIDGCSHLFFESIHLSLNRLWEVKKINFGLIETGCRYMKPGRYHDDIQIVTELKKLEKKTLQLKHRILAADDGALMVEGWEQRICMNIADPERLRAQDIPEGIRRILKDAMQ